jgi:hypothetical protein
MITDDTTNIPEKEEESIEAEAPQSERYDESPIVSLLWEVGTEVAASIGGLLARKYENERLDGKPKVV